MTMTMTNSRFGQEDMEDLLWGPSSPTADAMGSLFFQPDQEENQEGGGNSPEGDTSSVSSLTSSIRSPPNFYSPPSSPPAVLLHGVKAGNDSDLLTLPWLEHPDQLRCEMVSGDSKEDQLDALDWMAEKMDLSEFDLDSLIGSCSPLQESNSSTEDLLASLGCPMELDSLPMPTLSTPVLSPPSYPPTTLPTVCEEASVITGEVSYISGQEAPSPPPCVPEPQEELEIKSEPASPDPPIPMVDSPSSPVDTLDLGSEVDVLETEVKPVLAAVVPQVQGFVFAPAHLILVLTPKNEIGITTTTVTTTPEVVHLSPPASPPQRWSRSRPYPEPKYKASPPSPDATTVKVKSLCGAADYDDDDDDDDDEEDERITLKAPKDKKLKKMAQNKTAATRYRKKKRSEQDALSSEHSLLERKNMELREKAESMTREIKYLKELMEEVRLTRIRKGLSPDP